MKINIDNKHLDLYIKLRAELIQLFYTKYKNEPPLSFFPCPTFNVLVKIAEHDYNIESNHVDGLIISIDEMLTMEPDDAMELYVTRKSKRLSFEFVLPGYEKK